METGNTIETMSDEMITLLQRLVEINIDSAQGFKAASDATKDTDLYALFHECSAVRGKFASELRKFVRLNAQEPDKTGSIAGTLHRWWLDIRANLSTNERFAILAEAERGEDAIKHLYEDVLKKAAGSPVHDVLTLQYKEVKRIHDTIRDLRDASVD